MVAEEKHALNETTSFADKSEGEGRKQIKESACTRVILHVPLASSFAINAHVDQILKS